MHCTLSSHIKFSLPLLPGDDPHDDFACYYDPTCGVLDSEVDFSTGKTANLHNNFENRLCKKLRASGIANFALAKDCSVDLLENPGSFSLRFSETVVYEAQNTYPTPVEVSMVGLEKEPTAEEIKAFESAIVGAHNEAFGSVGYALTKFDAVSFMSLEGSVLVDGVAVPVVHKGEHNPEPSVAASIHKAFEIAFCDKLNNSGLAVFADIRDCSFNFVYNPVKEMSTKKGASATASA